MINKNKNVMLQITMPKEDYEQLCVLKKAFENNGIKVSKSDILVRSFRDYLRILVMTNTDIKTKEEKGNA